MNVRLFAEFTRDVFPRLVRHTGWMGLLIALGVIEELAGHTRLVAWTAFLLAAGATLGRAHDGVRRELRAERNARAEAYARTHFGADRAKDGAS